jgi:hypothetical protein
MQLYKSLSLFLRIQRQISVVKMQPIWDLSKDILIHSLDKIEEGLNELEEHDCQVERSSKIMRAIMNTLRPYYDLFRKRGRQ